MSFGCFAMLISTKAAATPIIANSARKFFIVSGDRMRVERYGTQSEEEAP